MMPDQWPETHYKTPHQNHSNQTCLLPRRRLPNGRRPVAAANRSNRYRALEQQQHAATLLGPPAGHKTQTATPRIGRPPLFEACLNSLSRGATLRRLMIKMYVAGKSSTVKPCQVTLADAPHLTIDLAQGESQTFKYTVYANTLSTSICVSLDPHVAQYLGPSTLHIPAILCAKTARPHGAGVVLVSAAVQLQPEPQTLVPRRVREATRQAQLSAQRRLPAIMRHSAAAAAA